MKSTIVSLVPFEIPVDKPTLANSTFVIPAAPDDDIIVFHVDDNRHGVHLPGYSTTRTITVPDFSREVARSIVEDYCNSQVGTSPDAGPGLFFIPDEIVKAVEARAKYAFQIEHYRGRQTRWFSNLVQEADQVWTATRQIKFVTDLQRRAARALRIQREWLDAIVIGAAKLCPACQMPTPPNAVVCGNCKCILDPERAKKLAFADVVGAK